MKSLKLKYSNFSESDSRLDASFHLSDGPLTIIKFRKCPYEISPLSLESERIFSGNIFKRSYVGEPDYGWPYFTGSDMINVELNNGKYISKKFTSQSENLTVKGNWILITCSGTLGRCVLTSNEFHGKIGTHDLIRVVPNENKTLTGYLFAFLSSRYGYGLITQPSYGGVIKHIEPHHLEKLPIPILPKDQQRQIHDLIVTASNLREQAVELLRDSRRKIKKATGIPTLKSSDYEHFGNHSPNRSVSTFSRKISEISPITINAFNHSKRVEKLENEIKQADYLELSECLDENQFFSTGSFKRVELDSPNSVRLINQSDIFNLKKQGKLLAKIYVKSDKLVEYGEVLIAGVGTLGEGETFCRAIFANEELEGQLISGEFIRMKTNDKVPSGYLYAWLSSDYGFRFIRKTQTGTKLCRPIQELLKNIPVPIIDKEEMLKIDDQVKKAHTMLFEALNAENKAIGLVENEIESWQKS